MKRGFIRLTAILVMILLSFNIYGCDTKEDAVQEEELPEMPKLEKMTLTFYFTGGRGSQQEEIEKKVREVLDEIEKRVESNLNVVLDFRFVEIENIVETFTKILKSDEDFEAFVTRTDWITSYIEKDLLLDLTNMFQEYAPQYYGKFTPGDLSQLTYDGKLMAIPPYMPRTRRMCVVVNKDLMKKYSIPEIRNYNDYEEFLKTIKENEPDFRPASMLYPSTWLFTESFGYDAFAYYLVQKWDDPEMKLIPWEQTDAFRESVQMFKRWIDNGYVAASGIGASGLSTTRTLTSVDHSIILDADTIMADASSVNNQEIDIYPLYMDKFTAAFKAMYNVILFNKNAANPERALMFINWVHLNQENYKLFMYGIEGKHYEIINGRISLPPAEENPFGFFWPAYADAFKDADLMPPLVSEPPGYRELLQKLMKNSRESPSKGFRWEMDDLLKDIVQKRTEAFEKFEKYLSIKGAHIDVDRFIREQEEIGANYLAQELSKQLYEWKMKQD